MAGLRIVPRRRRVPLHDDLALGNILQLILREAPDDFRAIDQLVRHLWQAHLARQTGIHEERIGV